jgi:SAM-dependent methyltransferase
MLVKQIIGLILRPHGKSAFLRRLDDTCSILDVGCGNNSPFYVKAILPHCQYTGIDVSDYNQSNPNLADHYIVTSPSGFVEEIAKHHNSFDALISAHNLEHCDDRYGTLNAMLSAIRVGGSLYLSFPTEDSTRFPSRSGTLNYFDDPTHKHEPPDFHEIVEVVKRQNFEILFSDPSYKPVVLWTVGLLLEWVSARRRTVLRGTWEHYGFEAIVWARRIR